VGVPIIIFYLFRLPAFRIPGGDRVWSGQNRDTIVSSSGRARSSSGTDDVPI
jgi:hypothetical protein